MKTTLTSTKAGGRDAALRRPRPERSAGRNERSYACIPSEVSSPDAALGDEDGAARRPYHVLA
ncbi:MAG: hypothetical protein NTZ16_09830 [Verrucomicrobia bacterium]|nr:hypothetical protein [Verrucomicrobiota bacterium]